MTPYFQHLSFTSNCLERNSSNFLGYNPDWNQWRGQIPNNIENLMIQRCPRKLSKDLLPASLKSLIIEDAPNIELELPSDLCYLQVHKCSPNINITTDNPNSLKYLTFIGTRLSQMVVNGRNVPNPTQHPLQDSSMGYSPHPTLAKISEILQHSIELKLCSSVSTHSVFWDTLMHDTNPDVVSLILSLLLTKYLQLTSVLPNNATNDKGSLVHTLMAILTNNTLQSTNDLLSLASITFSDPDDSTADDTTVFADDLVEDDDATDDLPSSSIGTPSSMPSFIQPQQQSSTLQTPPVTSAPSTPNTPSVSSSSAQSPSLINLSNEEIKDTDSMRSSIISTCYFVALFNNFNSHNPTLKLILSKFNDIIDRAKEQHSIELVRILSPGFKDTNDFIFYLIDHCSDLVLDSTTTTASKNYLRNSWYNACITELFQANTKSKAIFDNLFLFLKHPLLLEKRMMFFLQMLKHYLLVSPVFAPSALQSSMSIVKTYFLWPRPHCDFAAELLELLSIEYQCPGAYFRSMLASEFPSIMASPSSIGAASLSSTLFSMKNRPTIHMMIDRYNTEALSIQELFEYNFKKQIPSITQLQSNNIARLEFLEPIDISQFHYRIMDMLNKTIYLEESESKAVRIKELSALREDIVKNSTKTANKHVPQPLVLPTLNYHFSSLYRMSIKNKKPDEFATQYQFPVYKKTTNTLSNLFSNYQDATEPIKICIVGNDASIHHFVGSYVYLRYHTPDLFENLDVQFYLIPAGQNCRLTDFISSFDNCNYNNTDQSFMESMSTIKEERQSMSFKSSPTETMHEETTPNVKTPSSIILSEVEYLFREASFKMDIPLLKCVGWMDETCQTIPFFMRAEIGLSAFFQATGDNSLIESPLTNRMNKYTPVNVTVKFSQVNPLGVSQQMLSIDYKNYFEISVNNQMPKTSSTLAVNEKIGSSSTKNKKSNNNTSSSANSMVEMSIVEFDTKKKRMKTEEPTKFMANFVEIECNKDDKKKPFDVLLDGQLCGPYTKIKISYCKIEDETLLFPVMTFLPYH
eukprot:gene12616-14807_t